MAQPSQPNAIILAIQGLVTNPSTFDPKTSNGALTIANNVVIDRPNVVQSRRGFSNGLNPFEGASAEERGWKPISSFYPPNVVHRMPSGNNESTPPVYITGMYQFNGALITHCSNNGMYYDFRNSFNDTPDTFGEYTPWFTPISISNTYVPPSVTGIRSLELNKNFYFNTNEGTYRVTTVYNSITEQYVLSEPRKAGAPPGLGGSAVINGTTGFLPDNTSVAYRIVFGFKDSNDQLVLGAPSSRILISNSSGNPTNVDVTFQIPDEIQAAPEDWFFQVYRSHISPDLSTEPDDEMALAYEDTVSAFGSVPQITITDLTPENLLGAALYTNQGQDGILQSNYRPPWCVDMCAYKQYAFYANTRTLQNANLTLVSAGATNGPDAIIPGDIITFSMEVGIDLYTFTLTAGSTNDPLTGTFEVSNTGNPSYDIQQTAINLVNIANTYGNNTFLDAYYISTGTDLPGKMQFVRTSYVPDYYTPDPMIDVNNGSIQPVYYTFNICSSRTSCWEQPITTDRFSTTLISTNEVRLNRVYYSKYNQPEAVPVVNYFDVGSSNAPIRRILALRDGIMVLKDDGVFRISNAAAPFTVTPIDYDVKILAPRTAATLDNKVYFLSDQGVVALSDTDAQIMSFVLDKTVIQNTSANLFPNLSTVAWGIAYQSDRKYILFMPTTGTDTQATKQYVYNHLTQCWTNWDLQANCGVVFKRDGKLYLGGGGSMEDTNRGIIYQERKSFTNLDYADNVYAFAIQYNPDASKTLTLNLDNSATTWPMDQLLVKPDVGWTVKGYAIDSNFNNFETTATIVEVVSDSEYILDQDIKWDNSYSIFFYQPIATTVETVQLDCDNPGMNKQFSEIVYVFTTQDFNNIDVAISSNTTVMPALDTLVPTQRGGWGVTPWGPTPWGSGITGQGKIRRYMPQTMQRAGWLYLNLQNAECFTSFGWSGLELYYKQTSTRQR